MSSRHIGLAPAGPEGGEKEINPLVAQSIRLPGEGEPGQGDPDEDLLVITNRYGRESMQDRGRLSNDFEFLITLPPRNRDANPGAFVLIPR